MPKDAQKTAKNVYLFYGEDTYSSLQKLNFWQSEFTKKYGGETNIEILEGKILNPVEFDTNIGAFPFLSEKKLIIIKNFLAEGKAEAQKKVAESIEKTPDFTFVIFYETEMPDKRTSLFQKINKTGTAEEFLPPSPGEVTRLIMDRAKKNSIKISPATALYLATYCSLNLWLVFTELEKLATYANNREITREMIDKIVSPTISSSIFKLTDTIATKNMKESLRVFRILIDSGEEVGMIFFMIVRHFRILIQIKEMLEKNESQGTMIRRLKQHPFVIQTMSKQAKNFTTARIENIYEKLLEIDKNVKTGITKSYAGNTSEFQLAIERLIINCCK